MRNIVWVIFLLIMAGCNIRNNASDEEPRMSEKALLLYNKAEKKVADIEEKISELNNGMDRQKAVTVISEAKKLEYSFDSIGMNRAAINKCQALQQKIVMIRNTAIERAESIILQSNVSVCHLEDILIDKMTEYPVYLEKGDRLYFNIRLQYPVPVKLYNMDISMVEKSYNQVDIADSLVVKYPGIYLIEINADDSQYASVNIEYSTDSIDRRYNQKSIMTENISCSKETFRAYAVSGVKMQNMFEEPRKFTLRGQLKSAVSGSSIALVPISVPKDATDILYSMRIATSEQTRSSDGDFYKNMNLKYNQIKFMGYPLYERNHGSGILKSLLDDNRPLREEDAYCNMYLFRNQSDAKKFQDGTEVASNLKYDVDCSTIGTQSCNGRIPVNEAQKLYLGFENVRVRYANYLWVEAVAIVPTTEYYTKKYTVSE